MHEKHNSGNNLIFPLKTEPLFISLCLRSHFDLNFVCKSMKEELLREERQQIKK